MSFIYSFLAADSALLHLAKQGVPRGFGSRELRSEDEPYSVRCATNRLWCSLVTGY